MSKRIQFATNTETSGAPVGWRLNLGEPAFNALTGTLYIGNGEDECPAFDSTENLYEKFLPLSGGTLTGVLTSTFESNTWINGVSNAALTLNHRGYGAIFSAPMKDGRVCLSTYPASGNTLYFGYANNSQIEAGTNDFNTRMEWDAVYNRLTASYFKGAFEGNATTASALQTPRSLWGQSFNGSADISGKLSGVTGVEFTEAGAFNLTSHGNIIPTTDTDNNFFCIYKYAGRADIGKNTALKVYAHSGNVIFDNMVGIHTTGQPAYALDVNGTMNVTGAATFVSNVQTNGNIMLQNNNALYFRNNNNYITTQLFEYGETTRHMLYLKGDIGVYLDTDANASLDIEDGTIFLGAEDVIVTSEYIRLDATTHVFGSTEADALVITREVERDEDGGPLCNNIWLEAPSAITIACGTFVDILTNAEDGSLRIGFMDFGDENGDINYNWYKDVVSAVEVRERTADLLALIRADIGAWTHKIGTDGAYSIGFQTTPDSVTTAFSVSTTGEVTLNKTLTTSFGASHAGIKIGTSYLNSLNNQLLLQNAPTIRFGGDAWDWTQWAGLRYDHSNKTIFLGIADGTVFTANSAQSGGVLRFPGIETAYIENLSANGKVDTQRLCINGDFSEMEMIETDEGADLHITCHMGKLFLSADADIRLDNDTYVNGILDANSNIFVGESIYFGGDDGAYIGGSQGDLDIYLGQQSNLGINGDTQMFGTLHVTQGIYCDTYITALAQNTTSDARLKDITGSFHLSTETIAHAPSMAFRWRNNGEKAIGTLAQYWQEAAPLAVHEADGFLAMQYDVLAMLASISNAKKLLSHEKRIELLEEENRQLKEQLSRL